MNHQDISERPDVAVIILNWNGENLLRRFLPEVVRSTNHDIAHIIVVDNGSTDSSCRIVSEQFPSVELIRFDRNYGFAGGYNKAIEQTRYKYTVLLNSDVATTPGWIDTLYNYMECNSEVAACQPKILSVDHPERFEYAGAAGGYLDSNGYPFCRGRIFATCETDNGQYDSDADVFWASGACFMVRSDIYLSVGGLDTKFFAHMEEIDLCWRIHLAGYRIVAVGGASVYHLGGGSLPDSNPKKTYLNFRNNLLMLHKNLPDNIRSSKLFTRRLLDAVAWLKYILSFKFAFASAIIKAHTDFRKMRKNYTSHPAERVPLCEGMSRINILKAYYLQGRKHFSDLKC